MVGGKGQKIFRLGTFLNVLSTTNEDGTRDVRWGQKWDFCRGLQLDKWDQTCCISEPL